MLTKLLAVLAVGFALGQWVGARQSQALRTRLDKPRPKPDELSNWEGEGGSLTAAHAHLGTAPQQP